MCTAHYAAPADFLLAVMLALDVAKQASKPIWKLALCATIVRTPSAQIIDKGLNWT